MALTNKERQQRWYNRKRGFGIGKRSITMRLIVEFIDANNVSIGVLVRDVYRGLSAHRDKENWDWILGEIRYNRMNGDTHAPVTMIGTGEKGNPYYLRLSQEWDTTRNWDWEMEEKARLLREEKENKLIEQANAPREEPF